MQLLLRLALFLLFAATPVFAQVPGLTLDSGTEAEAAEPASGQAIDDLVRILQDDAARAALIERLQQAAPAEAAPEAPPDLSIARQLAEYTRSIAEGASSTAQALGGAIVNIRDAFSGTLNADYDILQSVLVGLAIVAVGLFGSFFILRLITIPLIARIESRLGGRSLVARFSGLCLAALVDAASVLVAWALGYVLALNTGTTAGGHMGINQSLLLNAFLVVEMTKLVFRVVLMPRFASLRLLPVTDENAAYWSFWAARIISLLGYTFMFVAPVLTSSVGRAAASAVQVLVMATAIIIGIIIVLQNRDDVRKWLTDLAGRRKFDGFGRVLVAIGQSWHILAIAYLLAILIAWFTNPNGALPFMLGATVQSVIAVVIGGLIVTFIGRFVSVGLRLPHDVKERLPLLETRLRAFVPRVMLIVRWIVIIGVVIAIGQAWRLFDFLGWIGSDEGLAAAGSVFSAALIVLGAIILHVVVASWVEYRLNTISGKVPTAREKTLLNLFKNAFTIALVVFGLMLALAQIGVNIAPLLAGAGVLGLAIGFGAQKLVQDIITGIFIQFENVMNEGDVVEAAGRSGVVEKLTIRSVTIRDLSGTVHLIPFSSVDQVSNMMRGFSFHVAEIGVAYDSDIEGVKQAMHDAFARLMETDHKSEILDDLDMQGVIAFEASSITVRARIKTLPGKHWAIGRKYNELLKVIFAERGIEIPFPHITYVQGGEARASGRVLHPDGDALPKPANAD